MAGTRATVGVQRFRSRKINLKQALLVIRETELDAEEYKDSLANEDRIETGVEKSEESEYHLQQALAAFSGRGNGKDAQNIVPAPPSKSSDFIEYDKTYTLTFKRPTPYIAFSETVEDTIACRYDMNSDDDEWLTGYNSKRPANSQCSEDVFERYMEYFEVVADTEAPFASLDQTIVPFETMALNIRTDLPNFDHVSAFFRNIYDYWRTRRQCSSNRSLQPTLKFEVHQEADDSDPYVCFRRRDVRQQRKTRGRDQHAQDKLKRLRTELEDGRLLILNWEQNLKDQQRATRHNRRIFQKRAEIRDMRCRLGLHHNDEDLVNQKPQKKKPAETLSTRVQQPLRQALQTIGRPLEREDNLKQIEDYRREKEEIIQKAIASNIEKLVGVPNKLFADFTQQTVSERVPYIEPSYRIVHTQLPISPPASTGGDMQDSATTPNTPSTPAIQEVGGTVTKRDYSTAFEITNKEPRYGHEEEYHHQYRRRIGRGGRLWIDRKGLKPQNASISARDAERWKYDQDSEDDEQLSIYEADPYSTEQLGFRSRIELKTRATALANHQIAPARGSQISAPVPAQISARAGHTTSSSAPTNS